MLAPAVRFCPLDLELDLSACSLDAGALCTLLAALREARAPGMTLRLAGGAVVRTQEAETFRRAVRGQPVAGRSTADIACSAVSRPLKFCNV